ncbi:MAG: polysaccharide biosynthesis/export family protein [Pirellulales bacterium]
METTRVAVISQSPTATREGRTGQATDVSFASHEPLQSSSRQSKSKSFSATTAFIVAWCVASTAMLIRLLASAVQIGHLLRSAVTCNNRCILAAVGQAALRLGIRAPRVLVSETVQLPTVFAFGRGMVLLPPDDLHYTRAAQGASSVHSRWYAILCHELGHVRRRDGWNRLAIEAATALLPWQPLLWCLRRQFLRNAEEACDDWAVASGADPIEFATVLTEYIPTVPHLLLGASIMSMDAKHRILRLLALRATPRPRTTRWQLMAIILVACAVVAGVSLAQHGDTEQDKKADRSASRPDAKADNSHERSRPQSEEKFVYRLEPPDIVKIQPLRLLPKAPQRIEKLDVLGIQVDTVLAQSHTRLLYVVSPDGDVNLGALFGRVQVAGLSVHEATDEIEKHLRKRLREPKVALSIVEKANTDDIGGIHSIAVDGYLNLGAYGQVYVSGMSIEEAREAIEKRLSKHFERPTVSMEIFAYNSKVYYVILEGGPQEDHLHRFPWTGNETVLDAIAQCSLRMKPPVRIWISRKNPKGANEFEQLPVDWQQLLQDAHAYKIFPGDRVYIHGAELLDQRPVGR